MTSTTKIKGRFPRVPGSGSSPYARAGGTTMTLRPPSRIPSRPSSMPGMSIPLPYGQIRARPWRDVESSTSVEPHSETTKFTTRRRLASTSSPDPCRRSRTTRSSGGAPSIFGSGGSLASFALGSGRSGSFREVEQDTSVSDVSTDTTSSRKVDLRAKPLTGVTDATAPGDPTTGHGPVPP